MSTKWNTLLIAVALILALTACGSKNEAAEPSESLTADTEVVIKASNWEFDKPEYELPKDTPVKLTLENLSGMHGIEIVGEGVKLRGDQSKVITLAAGTYQIKCNIPCGTGHNGMVANIVVK